MTHFNRVISEQVSLLFAIAVSLADRIILTALLFRFWGSALFGAWSAAVALAGLTALFELGFNMYFNNRLMIEVEQSRLADARRTYFMSNSIFVCLGIAGFLFMVLSVAKIQPSDAANSQAVTIAALAMAAAAAARIAGLGAQSLYRAHRRYAQLVVIQTSGEVLRIVASILAVLSGGGLVVVGISSAVAIVAVQVGFVVFDTGRRSPPHRYGFAIPRLCDMRDLFFKPTAFLAQTAPITLLTSLPVLILLKRGLGTTVLAGFVLVRTLSGLPRVLLQAFGIVIGQECGRRLALNDRPGAALVLAEGTRLFGSMSGLASGVLIAGGSQIVVLWTGHAELFRLDQLIAAILPMLVVSEAILAHNVLAASNAPYLAAGGRWAQITLTAIAAVVPLKMDAALQMQLALSLGEIFGFAPFAYLALSRLVPGTGIGFHARSLLFTLGAAVVGAGITYESLSMVGSSGIVETSLALIISLLACALLLPWLGLNRVTRRMLVGTVRPRLARIGILSKAR